MGLGEGGDDGQHQNQWHRMTDKMALGEHCARKVYAFLGREAIARDD